MTVYDILFLLTDDTATIAIYDMGAEKEIFCGSARDAMQEFGDYEVFSFDLDPVVGLILNTDTGEEMPF